MWLASVRRRPQPYRIRDTDFSSDVGFGVFLLEWPEEALVVRSISVPHHAQITLLGYETPLEWTSDNESIRIRLPRELESMGKWAWTFRIAQEGQ